MCTFQDNMPYTVLFPICLNIVNSAYRLHFCSTGKETSRHFQGLWFALRQPGGTRFYLTIVLWFGCSAQERLCQCASWTWPLYQKVNPSHCNDRDVMKMNGCNFNFPPVSHCHIRCGCAYCQLFIYCWQPTGGYCTSWERKEEERQTEPESLTIFDSRQRLNGLYCHCTL